MIWCHAKCVHVMHMLCPMITAINSDTARHPQLKSNEIMSITKGQNTYYLINVDETMAVLFYTRTIQDDACQLARGELLPSFFYRPLSLVDAVVGFHVARDCILQYSSLGSRCVALKCLYFPLNNQIGIKLANGI